jgi:hypothetical protein
VVDPETRGLIELARQEREAIRRGQKRPEDAIYHPPGTRFENARVILPPTGVWSPDRPAFTGWCGGPSHPGRRLDRHGGWIQACNRP